MRDKKIIVPRQCRLKQVASQIDLRYMSKVLELNDVTMMIVTSLSSSADVRP